MFAHLLCVVFGYQVKWTSTTWCRTNGYGVLTTICFHSEFSGKEIDVNSLQNLEVSAVLPPSCFLGRKHFSFSWFVPFASFLKVHLLMFTVAVSLSDDSSFTSLLFLSLVEKHLDLAQLMEYFPQSLVLQKTALTQP